MLVIKDAEQEDGRSFDGKIATNIEKSKMLPIKDEDEVRRLGCFAIKLRTQFSIKDSFY